MESLEDLKVKLINEINTFIKKRGNFSVWDVEADHSPHISSRGRLSHLIEEFKEGTCIVRVYDPSSYSSDEIDEYDEFYENVEVEQLEYILELTKDYEEICLADDEE